MLQSRTSRLIRDLLGFFEFYILFILDLRFKKRLAVFQIFLNPHLKFLSKIS